jgi:hypothetical protein
MADAILDWASYVTADSTITTGPQEAYRIKVIGTDSTTEVTPIINGNELGGIKTDIAALHPTGATEHGGLMLSDLYYYIPPETQISLDGASGDEVYLAGSAIDAPSGRFEASADETRFNEQGSHHYTFVEGSTTVAEPLSDGQEVTPLTLQPETDERFIFDGLHGIDVTFGSATTLSEGDLAMLLDFDGQRRPSQFRDDEIVGIDLTVMPRPPNDTDHQAPYRYGMGDSPVAPFTISGDQTFNVNVRNVSGGSLGSSTNDVTLDYIAAVEFQEGLR